MAGSPNANRTQIFFLGFHDPSNATAPLFGADDVADDDQGRAIFGATGVVKRVLMHVVETFSAHDEVVTLQWRPTPGSATGEIDLGVYTIPASTTAADFLVADFNANPNTSETSIIAASQYTQGGIGGSGSVASGADVVFGPGGEFQLSDVGSGTAGQVNVYLEVELHNLENGPQTITYLTATGASS